MGLEATWSLVDIPDDARDAAQAAARREGLSVGEWLTRRILKRFSELNVREQEDAFVALRNHVSGLAHRIDRLEIDTRSEPMRQALKKLHDGLARLNDELLRTAGHSVIQISQLSTSLDAMNARVGELHEQDAESRSAFERRIAQLQEFVESTNLRHATETRSLASRMDTLGGTLAESRSLTAGNRSAIERLEETVATADARYNGAFRSVNDKFESLSTALQRAVAAAAESSAVLDQRIASLQAELGRTDTRHIEETQQAVARAEKLQGRIDELQSDLTGMCGALDRRVLLSQQALQALDSRHSEMSQSLTRNVEAVAAKLETVRESAAQSATTLETRLANLETNAANADSTNAAADNRFAAIEHQLLGVVQRTEAATSAASALLPRTEAMEARLEQLNSTVEAELQGQQHAIDRLKNDLLQQTLNAVGEKLEIEGKKHQAAIADLKNGLLDQLSQAFDERGEAEERKQQGAMAQLQSGFASALQSLGETFESEARKQQEAIAELKASLYAAQSASPQPRKEELAPDHKESADTEQRQVAAAITVGDTVDLHHDSQQSVVPPIPQLPEDHVLELTNVADEAPPQGAAPESHTESVEPPAPHQPALAPAETAERPMFEHRPLAAVEELAPAAMMARTNNAEDTSTVPPSYLSAARQSLQAAAVRDEAESPGKEFFGSGFVKSLSLAIKAKGQATSYALIAGIALVALLALVVGAGELMRRSEPSGQAHPFAKQAITQAKLPQLAKYVGPKNGAKASAASVVSGQDRTASLARQGNGQAQLLLGLRELAKNDAAIAAPWLERAAIQGVPVAQYRLATLYASGRGIPADKLKAFRWYLAAAQAGNRKAMSNLAVAYAQGDGTAKNPQEAGRWFLKAAQLGLADAQFDLAILYERGLGVPQNLTDAYRWYVIAAKAGDTESKERADALASQLNTEDRAAAETAAAEFKPLPMNGRANEPQ